LFIRVLHQNYKKLGGLFTAANGTKPLLLLVLWFAFVISVVNLLSNTGTYDLTTENVFNQITELKESTDDADPAKNIIDSLLDDSFNLTFFYPSGILLTILFGYTVALFFSPRHYRLSRAPPN
jgi:hypothetical protein